MKIDFVITWVDGNDIEWRKEKIKYDKSVKEIDASEVRYRDWEILKYWFRSIEKFAPWVNNIYFLTYGHLPKWLNLNHPKLKIVKHEEFIPEQYLPTFSSHTIENNMHRIKGLSEHFVYFNDDMFILRDVKENDFFKDGMPCDSYAENTLMSYEKGNIFPFILLNDMCVINSHFDKKKVIKKNFFKYYNFKYGIMNLRTLLLSFWKSFVLLYDTHIPVSLCKSTLEKVWEKEYEWFNETCMNKFRSQNDVSQYVFRYWQLLSGNFCPRSFKFGKRVSMIEDDIFDIIENQKYKVVCLNDDNDKLDFDITKEKIIKSFEKILPEKSKFEN